MLAYQHSGFSVDASVRIEAQDRAGLERLLRYCARPPFAMERLRKEGSALAYRCAKQHSEPVGGKVADIILTPLELIDRNAALVPPPRTHRHRYYGVLAPNSPLRGAVTALAQAVPTQPKALLTDSIPLPSTRVGRCYRRCHQRRSRQATRASTRDAQALPRALPVGRTDRPYLRGVPTDLPDLRRPDTHHRVHHRWGRGEEDTGAHRLGLSGPAYLSSTRATAVGRVRCAAARGCGGTARLESGGATSARLSGRSARQLETGQTERRFDSDCFGVGLRALWIKGLVPREFWRMEPSGHTFSYAGRGF